MSDDGERRFPDGFAWGAATAAYQVEGAVTADGRGPSIWDTFCTRPSTVDDGSSGAVACDHYNRYIEDIDLLKHLGVHHYRFSVAWPRVMPDGRTVEQRGLDHYHQMVDRLLERDITPVVTLYHWDLPQAVEDRGGWLSRDTASAFADYASAVHRALGDRVATWTTLNEPFCSAFLGYGSGVHAPGIADHGQALVAAHHHLLAHGMATQALRAIGREPDAVSIALNFSPVLTDVDDDAHREAARRFDGIHNRFFLDPVLGRGYPADVLADVAPLAALEPAIRPGDLDLIGQPIDWLGVNYYAPTRVVPLADPGQQSACPLPALRGMDVQAPRGPLTAMGWEQHPESLTRLLTWLDRHIGGLPLVVVENGAAFDDTVEGGRVRDTAREDYFRSHIRAVHAAIEQGATVTGYFAWSLLDNFEWSFGYTRRFGVIHVDFDTQQRTIKDSAWFFGNVATHNACPAAD